MAERTEEGVGIEDDDDGYGYELGCDKEEGAGVDAAIGGRPVGLGDATTVVVMGMVDTDEGGVVDVGGEEPVG